jgi:hypothetical protein
MKIIFPFVSLVIFPLFCMVSCGSKDANKKSAAIQTLEERYPGWANRFNHHFKDKGVGGPVSGESAYLCFEEELVRNAFHFLINPVQ